MGDSVGEVGDMGSTPGLALGWEDPLEQEMATYSSSSILAWKTPWTEEPAGYSHRLNSVGQ